VVKSCTLRKKMKKIIITLIILLSVSTGVYAEMEPNNIKEQAAPATSKVPIIGNTMSESDEDWFYIETSGAENIFCTFGHTLITTYYQFNMWIISMYDDHGNMLASKNAFSNESSTSLGTGVGKSGKYYIQVIPAEKSTNSTFATYYDKHYQDQYTLTVTIGEATGDLIYTQAELDAEYNRGYTAGKSECSGGLYTQADVDEIIKAVLKWGDMDGDGKIGLSEAIHALQVTVGIAN